MELYIIKTSEFSTTPYQFEHVVEGTTGDGKINRNLYERKYYKTKAGAIKGAKAKGNARLKNFNHQYKIIEE